MYSVEWTHQALSQLADIWTSSGSDARAQVTAAVNLLDRLLTNDPLQQGESREGDRRVTFAAPLGIDFQVDIRTRQAIVIEVWFISMRNQ